MIVVVKIHSILCQDILGIIELRLASLGVDTNPGLLIENVVERFFLELTLPLEFVLDLASHGVAQFEINKIVVIC